MGAFELDDHYADGAEAGRLTRSMHGRLEFLRTQELVRRFIPPPPAVVLDVGGATGVHAGWLAADGYRVHVVDPVAIHVDTAAALSGVTAEVGDARDLKVPSSSMDAVLLLGPLYHLAQAHDRALALRESRRTLRPGGLLFAAAISRYLTLLELGANGRLGDELLASVDAVIQTGRYDGHAGFVSGRWHNADELRTEVQASGFQSVEVFGIGGPAWPTLDALGETEFETRQHAAIESARLVEQDPLLLHTSAHLLAVGTA